MSIEVLRKSRNEIANRWLDCILSTYPRDSIDFFKNQKNRFSNPIGATFRTELPLIVDELTGEMDELAIRKSVGAIIKIRAVQEYTPEQAIDFVLRLKEIVREVASELQHDDTAFVEIDSRTDRLYRFAADAYAECREVIQRIRQREATMNTFSPLGRRAFVEEETAGDEADNTGNNPSVKRREGSGR